MQPTRNRPPMPLAPFVPCLAPGYPVLLDAYPCPAFVVRARSTLRPIWANRAYEAAFGSAGVELKDSFVHVLASTEDGQRYGFWSVDEPRGKKRSWDERPYVTSTLTVRVKANGRLGDLHLVKTRLDDLLIVTSTLELSHDESPVPPKRQREALNLGPLPPLKLSNTGVLTPEGTPVIPSQSPIGSRSIASKVSHTLGAVVQSPCPTATAALFKSHPWHTTPLGDRSTWSERLRAAVNIMQTSPHPVSLFARRSFVT